MTTTASVANGSLTLAALQGPNTFGGEAARRFVELYPELFSNDVIFFDTAEEALGFNDGRADASCAPQQMTLTGYHPGIQAYIARPESKLHVIAEATHAYRCSLLVKPGTKFEAIRRVQGHTGSITQSRGWLEKNAPHVEIFIVDTSSMDAASQVAKGDGTLASIGTSGMAREFGLEELVKDVDGGSIGSYWAVSPKPIFSATPARVIVAGRFHDDGKLTAVICGLQSAGYTLETIFTAASGQRLFEYDYVMRFRGAGALAQVEAAVSSVPGARLAGAFDVKE
jgi:prephenate dehydratase